MSLLDMLTNKKSTLTPFNGTTPQVNPLATAQSNLHADPSGKTGYSMDGSNILDVNSNYQLYLDGTNNTLPQPTKLDLNGTIPPFSSVPNSSQEYPYINNLPK